MQRFKVIPDNSPEYEVQATTRDVVRWEKTNKGASVSALQNEPRMVDLYAIAWIASQRAGHFPGSLEDFEDTCDVEVIDDEEPDPTQSGATAAE